MDEECTSEAWFYTRIQWVISGIESAIQVSPMYTALHLANAIMNRNSSTLESMCSCTCFSHNEDVWEENTCELCELDMAFPCSDEPCVEDNETITLKSTYRSGVAAMNHLIYGWDVSYEITYAPCHVEE